MNTISLGLFRHLTRKENMFKMYCIFVETKQTMNKYFSLGENKIKNHTYFKVQLKHLNV